MLNLIAYNLNKYSLRDMNTSYCDFKIDVQHCTILCKKTADFSIIKSFTLVDLRKIKSYSILCSPW